MKRLYFIPFILLLSMTIHSKAFSQSSNTSGFDIEVDPIAFALNGFSFHGGYITSAYRFDVGIFGLDLPEWIHGNEDFESSFVGAGWKVDRFFKGRPDGFFTGIAGNVNRIIVTHAATDVDRDRVEYALAARGGYRWNTGLGNLYVVPFIELGFTLNPEDITVEDDVFEASAFTPFPTIHLGWQF